MPEDYLQIEQPLIDRLKAETGINTVMGWAEAGEIEDLKKAPAPSLAVIYLGDRSAGAGRQSSGRQIVRQVWGVGILVRNVRDTKRGTAARSEAGPLMTQVINALNGWRPDLEGVGEFERDVDTTDIAYDAGTMLVNLAFTVPAPTGT